MSMIKTVKVINIIFKNDDNGYHIIEVFSNDAGIFVAKGYFPTIREGSLLSIKGDFVIDPKYGEQFNVEEVYLEAPAGEQEIFDYLSSGMIKGVGPSLAEKLVDTFGVKTLEIIEKNPKALLKVPGIGAKKMQNIVDAHAEFFKMQELISFCIKYEIPNARAIKIYNHYGEDSLTIIKENPYQLVEDIEGIGFIKADKMALSLGIEKNSKYRVSAAIMHALSEASKKGHTCLPSQKLIGDSLKLLGFDENFNIRDYIDSLIEQKKLYKVNQNFGNKEVETIATSLNFHTENGIFRNTVRLIRESKLAEKIYNGGVKSGAHKEIQAKNYIGTDELFNTSSKEVDDEKKLTKEYMLDLIAKFEKSRDVIFDENQKQAILNSFLHGVSIITGGPGTGKTTIIDCIVHICMLQNLEFVLGAPTGRASKRLSEATKKEASTIHRLLGVTMDDDGKLKFKYNKANQLKADVVIIDEVSMADIYIFYALIQAIKNGAKLILVGDKDQLPSVSAGNILADYIKSEKISVTFLTNIYRQDENSLIVYNAHKINRGEMPDFNNRSKDFFLDNLQEPDDIIESVKSCYCGRIERYFGMRRDDIQILCPVKKGPIGTESINKILQKELVYNPDGRRFAVGDKVMQIVNNYEIEWEKSEQNEKGTGIFNGEIGRVTNIDARSNITVTFDDGKSAVYTSSIQSELMLAYAISVHKSQGSEFKGVVLVLGNTTMPLLTRNLLYTALTRAREMVLIIGTKDAIRNMIKNNHSENRYTLLLSYLEKANY